VEGDRGGEVGEGERGRVEREKMNINGRVEKGEEEGGDGGEGGDEREEGEQRKRGQGCGEGHMG